MTHNINTQNGFTFFEVLVTLLIVGIVSGFGAPALATMLNNGQDAAGSHELQHSLDIARNEAVYQGIPVTVCALGDASENACANDKDASWNRGWIIFHDRAGKTGQVDEGDQILTVIPAGEIAKDIIGDKAHVTFEPNGRIQHRSVTFKLDTTDCSAEHSKTLWVPRSGAARLEDVNCNA